MSASINEDFMKFLEGDELNPKAVDKVMKKEQNWTGSTFNEYQKLSQATAVYPKHDGFNIAYPVLGLTGEAGEVANEMKKVFRDDGGVVTPERKAKIVDEMSDCLWYIAALATELNVDLGDIATHNLEKLRKRYALKALEQK